jgi:hypothetical protein
MMAITKFVAAVAAVSLLVAAAAGAQSVMIAPGSLVLSDTQRSGEITVANTEDRTVTYRVEPALFRMRADGFLDEVDSLEQSAAALVRFAPRQFNLDAGAAQVVRVAFRAPVGLPNGEYRLHLRMRNMGTPVKAEPDHAAVVSSVAGEVTLQVPVTVARAARILVRHGVGPGNVALGTLQAQRVDAASVHVDLSLLNRRDGGSATGTLVFDVAGRAPSAGAQSMRRRYSVYADLERRDYEFVLPVGGGQPAQICVAVVPDGVIAGNAPVDRRCVSA